MPLKTGTYSRGFISENELKLSEQFLNDGYIIAPVNSLEALNKIQEACIQATSKHLGIKNKKKPQDFLNSISEHIEIPELNDLRLSVFNNLNSLPDIRSLYFSLARKELETLVGNELSMQKRINLSIQLPNDSSSLLPTHSDVWSGDSPFEVVVWLPLVDCYKTKSMYLLPPDKDKEFANKMHEFSKAGAGEFYKEIEPHLKWLDVPYGHFLLFTHTLMHGNVVNEEAETRWSMNCRFKSALSPYSEKRIGEFFEPITIKPATRIGMNYTLPKGFRE